MNKSIWTIAALALVLTACKSTPMNPAKVEDSSVTRPMTNAKDSSADSSANTDKINIKTVDVDTSKDELSAAELAKRQVFFDYDSDAIREEYKSLIANHAKYLVAHPQTKVVLQGNTDERGTHEYNLALGQRRSVAVKNALNVLGVNDSQIETVSYGEERAKANCADDGCFQQDRRVDIVYAGQ
ncbi:peptidoglycan-associated lipoprotein Pal [Methylophilus sp.]|jgi:peptidoglycan-associated lipoprotein|uniref:peptidoglycan-associated lipoprotein Pal n=1 Tax=Methylophilus sp. TaxID=29541 RepID=UPI000D41FD10|nr:peptidoglycan-associated lipoprotein Pal [Methylophilus sp.]PPD12868.1 MAG: peptidoglycan-associated lipoprotein [Methylophilus sp.]